MFRYLALSIGVAGVGGAAQPGYADPAVCAGCHRQIAETYARTGMGRSFRPVRAETRLPEFDGSRYDHAASREHFTTLRRGGVYYVRRDQTGPGGPPVNLVEVPAAYL